MIIMAGGRAFCRARAHGMRRYLTSSLFYDMILKISFGGENLNGQYP